MMKKIKSLFIRIPKIIYIILLFMITLTGIILILWMFFKPFLKNYQDLISGILGFIGVFALIAYNYYDTKKILHKNNETTKDIIFYNTINQYIPFPFSIKVLENNYETIHKNNEQIFVLRTVKKSIKSVDDISSKSFTILFKNIGAGPAIDFSFYSLENNSKFDKMKIRGKLDNPEIENDYNQIDIEKSKEMYRIDYWDLTLEKDNDILVNFTLFFNQNSLNNYRDLVAMLYKDIF